MDEKDSHHDIARIRRMIQKDDMRLCGNPECLRIFKAASKHNPNQTYCGCAECNRSRGRQRKARSRHPKLFREVRPWPGAAAVELPAGYGVSLRLLWLFAGCLASSHGLRSPRELAETMAKAAEAGRRLFGSDGGLSLIADFFVTGAMGEMSQPLSQPFK